MNWKSIQTRLGLAFFAMAFFSVILGILTVSSLNQALANKKSQFDEVTKPTGYITEATQSAARIRIAIREFILARNDAETDKRLEVINTEAGNLLKATENLKSAMVTSEAQKKTFATYNDVLQGYLPIVGKMIEYAKAREYDAAKKYLFDVCIHQQAKFEPAINDMREAQREFASAMIAADVAESQQSIHKATVIAVVAFLVAAVFSWLAPKRIIAPVREMTKRMQDIASGDGDLRGRIDVKGEDELSVLAKSFNSVFEKIEGVIASLRKEAQSNNSRAAAIAKAANTQGEMTRSTGQILGSLAQIAREQSDIATTAQESVKAVYEESVKLSGVATQQAQEVQQANETLETVRTSVEASASAVDEASTSFQEVVTAAQQGASAAQHSADTMERVQQASVAAQHAMTALAESSSRIEAIVAAIDEIAGQTNLLALNAAIEAARAGDQGKGFAVVADEVRKLAERSSEQTKVITDLVREVEEARRSAEEAIVASAAAIQEGRDRTLEINSVLLSITDAAQSASDGIRRSTALTQEALGGVQKGVAAMDRAFDLSTTVDQSVGEALATAREAAQELDRLARLANESQQGATDAVERAEAQLREAHALDEAARDVDESAQQVLKIVSQFRVNESSRAA